jgi:hypothetical protein
MTVSLEPLRGTKRAVAALAEGELAKALGYLEAIQAKEDGELGAQAKILADEIHEHLVRVLKQIEELLAVGEAVLGVGCQAQGRRRAPDGIESGEGLRQPR